MKNIEFDFYDKTSLKSYNLDESMQYQLNMLDRLDVFTRKHCENVASITPEKWYKVRVTVNNKFEEYSVSVTDIETGKVVGQLEEASYSTSQPADCAGIKISCWGYMRGNTYNYDMTNVTIARSDTKYSINWFNANSRKWENYRPFGR